MATLLLTYANSETNRLPTLTREYQEVSDALRNRQANKDFTVIADPTLNRDKMAKDIRANESDICLFLFSGHAGRDQLFLEDGAGDVEGIAALLGRCPSLKLVILNGCSTQGQVGLLLEKNVPIVVATSSAVDDEKATRFSIQFFTELAKGLSIREAYERGIERAKLYGKIQHVSVESRGVGLPSSKTNDEPLWGLYYNQNADGLLDTWRLPVREQLSGADELNQDIKKALVGIAKKYSISATPNAVLERLPFTINEPIRNLFAIKAETQEPDKFYDTPSWNRYQMILYAYRAVVNLTTYTLLAEIWEKELQNQLSENTLGLIEAALFSESTNDSSLSHLELMTALGRLWRNAKEPSFLSEISWLIGELEKDILKKALDDLESKIADQDRLKRSISSPADVLRLCLEAEKSFSFVLYTFGFWVNYSLTSVKDIELFKFRHLQTSYLHRIVRLQIGYIIPAKITDDQYSASQPLDTSSIILQRQGNWAEGLNLSPFLIDKNALIKAPKADLHYLLSFSPKQDFFCYRRVTSNSDVWPIRPEKKLVSDEDIFFGSDDSEIDTEFSNYHSLLKDLCASFSQSVLNKSLNEL
ncbi:hypothetical protein [Spirosoma sp. KNUC1025]|uniref:hypothetical protein n=1 Tax=Spirosoma sp. KNUC1025 TaxID=2894082 RepID=UPI003862FEB6|nr:CHAT domain-containing protein [Spirosoma sp. KNUC1025]